MDFSLTDEQDAAGRHGARAARRASARRRWCATTPTDPTVADGAVRPPPARVGGPRRRAARRPCLFVEEAGAGWRPGPFFVDGRAVRPAARGRPTHRWPMPPLTGEVTGHRGDGRTPRASGSVERRRRAHRVLDADRSSIRIAVVAPGPRSAVVDVRHLAVASRRAARSTWPAGVLDARRADAVAAEPVADRPDRAATGASSGPPWSWPPSWSASPAGWSRDHGRPTPASGCSSASRSARSRRCSTGWSARRSTTSGPPPRSPYAAMAIDADDADADRAVHVAKAAAGRPPGTARGRPAGARRHRVHVGARPPPLPAPGLRERRSPRHRRVAPRPTRRPRPRLKLLRVASRSVALELVPLCEIDFVLDEPVFVGDGARAACVSSSRSSRRRWSATGCAARSRSGRRRLGSRERDRGQRRRPGHLRDRRRRRR